LRIVEGLSVAVY